MTESHPGVRRVSDRLTIFHQITSNQQLETLNAGGGIAVRFAAPGRAAPGLFIEGVQSPQFSVWVTRSASGFLSRPCFEAALVTVRFVDRGTMIRREGRFEHAGPPRTAMLVAFDTMRSEEASGDFSAVSGTVTREALARGHDALSGRDDGFVPDFEPVVDAEPLPIRALRGSLERVAYRARALDPDDLVLGLFEEILVYQILSAWPQRPIHELGRVASTSPPAVRQAIDYIEENLARGITLSEVAAAVGISVRSLQLGFRKALDVTPVAFIIDRRLRAVRDDLCDPRFDQLTIGQIARRWGFTHLGDFGQRFRLLFGASASELRRGRTIPDDEVRSPLRLH